ncbi:MAG: sugar-binding transcriptional regulator, partial [Chloroflexota bacterium]
SGMSQQGCAMANHLNRQQLVAAAKMYYEQNLTQSEIGRRLNTSRSTVSRLLQEARDTGIVQITINYTWERDTHLETELMAAFDLKDVRVLKSFGHPIEDVMQGMGQLAARYLNRITDDNMVLGVSYGRSVEQTVQQVPPTPRENVTVVQIIGALGSNNPLIEGVDLTRALAAKYTASYRYLHSPLIVEDVRIRDLLVTEPSVQDVLSIGRQSDIALLGIGALGADTSGSIWMGYLTRKELAHLHAIGAVGHMCAEFFDEHGNIVDVDLNRRSISIGLNALRQIQTVVAVAGTVNKARAILGALRGNYIDVLITDDSAAVDILSYK